MSAQQPTAAAMRAAEAACDYFDEGYTLHVDSLSRRIDEVIGLSQLVGACKDLLGLIALLHANSDIPPEVRAALPGHWRVLSATQALARVEGTAPVADRPKEARPEPAPPVAPIPDEPSCPECGGEMRLVRSGWYCEDRQCPGVREADPNDHRWLALLRKRIEEIDGMHDALDGERDSLQSRISRAKAGRLLDAAVNSKGSPATVPLAAEHEEKADIIRGMLAARTKETP